MQGTETWQYTDGDEIRTLRPQGRFKADNGVALAAAAAAGLGIAWLPDCITYEDVASGRLVRVMTHHPPPPAATYVVRPPGPHAARKVRELTELLIEHFQSAPELWGLDAAMRGPGA
jgi:DNA-binding transcriptional LysR family regulator